MPELTSKEKKFCEEYVKDYNATQAYLRAFNSSYETANKRAYLMLKSPEAKGYIKTLEQEIFDQNMITANHLANELATIAFSQDPAILNQKLKAIELLQKQYGLQTNKNEISLKDVINITIE